MKLKISHVILNIIMIVTINTAHADVFDRKELLCSSIADKTIKVNAKNRSQIRIPLGRPNIDRVDISNIFSYMLHEKKDDIYHRLLSQGLTLTSGRIDAVPSEFLQGYLHLDCIDYVFEIDIYLFFEYNLDISRVVSVSAFVEKYNR